MDECPLSATAFSSMRVTEKIGLHCFARAKKFPSVCPAFKARLFGPVKVKIVWATTSAVSEGGRQRHGEPRQLALAQQPGVESVFSRANRV